MEKGTIRLVVAATLFSAVLTFGVTIEEVTNGFEIQTETAKWFFESHDGISGFGGLWDNDDNDWLQCYGGGGTPGNRGFPNSMGNFGHANRSSGATNTVRDGVMSGDHVIIDAQNSQLHFAYHFFEDHMALEVVAASIGYHFLYESTTGGSVYAKYWTADGNVGQLMSHQDFTPEWIYLTDAGETCAYKLLMVKTPDDNAPNECWQQGGNMGGFSWGRYGPAAGYDGGHLSGLDHKISLAMIPKETPYAEIKEMAEALMANHLEPLNDTSLSVSAAKTLVPADEAVALTATTSPEEVTMTVNWTVTAGGTLSAATGTEVTVTLDGSAAEVTVTATVEEIPALTKDVTVNLFDIGSFHLKVNAGAANDAVSGWQGGASYATGGESYSFPGTPSTAGVEDAAPADVYKTVLHGEAGQEYSVDIPDGDYEVIIHTYDGHSESSRSMTISIEGTAVMEAFAPAGTPAADKFDVTVSNGDGLQISVTASSGDAFICGFEVLGGSGSTVVSRNAMHGNLKPGIMSLGGAKYQINVPSSDMKRLEIINSNGSVVGEFRNNGFRAYVWDASALASGVYLLNVATSTGSFVSRFVVSK